MYAVFVVSVDTRVRLLDIRVHMKLLQTTVIYLLKGKSLKSPVYKRAVTDHRDWPHERECAAATSRLDEAKEHSFSTDIVHATHPTRVRENLMQKVDASTYIKTTLKL